MLKDFREKRGFPERLVFLGCLQDQPTTSYSYTGGRGCWGAHFSTNPVEEVAEQRGAVGRVGQFLVLLTDFLNRTESETLAPCVAKEYRDPLKTGDTKMTH